MYCVFYLLAVVASILKANGLENFSNIQLILFWLTGVVGLFLFAYNRGHEMLAKEILSGYKNSPIKEKNKILVLVATLFSFSIILVQIKGWFIIPNFILPLSWAFGMMFAFIYVYARKL